MQIVPTTTMVAARHEVFTTEEEAALVGFLAGYSGLTFEAYQLDLRQWLQWCAERPVAFFCARRAASRPSAVTSKPAVAPERRSRDACARSPAFTDTPKKKDFI